MGSVEDDLAAEWFTHQVVFHVGSGASPYGPSAGDDVAAKCHVRQQVQRVETPQGQQTVTDTIVYAPLKVMAERGDTLTLPAPFEPGPWQIIAKSVHHGADLSLPNHQKFVCDTPTAPVGEVSGPYG